MPTQNPQSVAQDGFDEYYAEKLWNWIPAFYRDEDATTNAPGTLRGIVETLGEQAGDLRRFLDRLWENHFVELADDEALIQLGELVATRMVHPLNRRGRRVDVARTIFYRRRKGTPWVLERLITDITGWTGSHLDTRRRLARSFHLLEPPPELTKVTKTRRGGWANLRSPRIPALAWTAFEELNHTPDFRRHAGHEGRYGIPKIGVHIHRLRALELQTPTAMVIGGDPGVGGTWKFALDPSGRAAPLFQPADRPSGDSWSRPNECQMPRAIDCRLLAHAEYEWSDADIDGMGLLPNSKTRLKNYSGVRIPSTTALERLISSCGTDEGDIRANIVELRSTTMQDVCGLARLYGPDLVDGGNQALELAIAADTTAAALTREQILVGKLSEWGASFDSLIDGTVYDLVVDPTIGAVISKDASDVLPVIPKVLHHGATGLCGAGGYDRRETLVTEDVEVFVGDGNLPGPITFTPSGLVSVVDELRNSKTYTGLPNPLDHVEDYTLQAANFQRPYLLITDPVAATWTIEAEPKGPQDVRNLVFDGLWIGVEDGTSETVSLQNPGDPVVPLEGKIVLTNTWDRVEFRHCTFDPGGEKLRETPLATPQDVVRLRYVTLELQGYVEELVIESSILGPIVENVTGADPCSIGKLIIRDSIIYSSDIDTIDAITTTFGEVHLERCTVVGSVKVHRLYASDTLIIGAGTIADLQHGCFRFSAGVQGSWPKPYESYLYTGLSASWIESNRFGDPGFMRLTELAPKEIRAGAENHCEMGAFNRALEGIKRADLRTKLEEFMPFDLIEQLVTDN